MSDEASPLATVLAEAFWKCMDENRDSLDGDFHDSSIGLIDGALPPEIFGALAQVAERHYRPRVETVEQLDALPVGAVIADIQCDLTPPPVYVRFKDSWSLDGYKGKPGRRNLTILWSPGAGE